MKEHGLIYTAENVLAILDGRKTMTRRIVTFDNSVSAFSRKMWCELDFDHAFVDHGPSPLGNPGPYLKVPFPKTDGFNGFRRHETRHRVYPRVQVGDKIWVRETWKLVENDKGGWVVLYRADIPEEDWELYGPWNSPIFMPRGFSRLVRPVIEVVAERVQDISGRDVFAEGAPSIDGSWPPSPDAAVSWFTGVWNSIHGPDAWARNDWVWGYRWKDVS